MRQALQTTLRRALLGWRACSCDPFLRRSLRLHRLFGLFRDVRRNPVPLFTKVSVRRDGNPHIGLRVQRGSWGSSPQLALLRHGLQHSGHIYTIQQHKNTHGIAYDTAPKDLAALADDHGFFMKVTRGRSFLYVAPSDLRSRLLDNVDSEYSMARSPTRQLR